MKRIIAVLVLAAFLFGCIAGGGESAANNGTAELSSAVAGNGGETAVCGTGTEGATKLTFIKFHGNSQCTSCTNLGKFTERSLEKNFGDGLECGTIGYLDINAEADPYNPLVLKYRPTHASLYLETSKDGTTGFEELSEAWYYTTDETAFEAFISTVVSERMGG